MSLTKGMSMKKDLLTLMVMGICFVNSACGTESTPESEPEEVSTSQSELSVCGGLCPPGYTFSFQSCLPECGGICPNAVSCVPLPPGASISASPTIISAPLGGTGTSRICWTTTNVSSPLWIRVRVDGGLGALFTKESDNGQACENAPWIVAGHQYDFRVHTSDSDSAPELARVQVTGVLSAPAPDDPPGACEPGGSGVCPAGKDCHCGESFCTGAGQICP
jgi:hypothetical protein